MGKKLINKLWIFAENMFRERDASAFLSLFRFCLLIFIKNDQERLKRISSAMAYWPNLPFSDYLSNHALTVASRISKKNANTSSQLKSENSLSLSYSIIIKPYISESEKGVLVISFEKELEKIINNNNLKKIESYFHIIFIPSWTGLFSPVLFKLAVTSSQLFFVLPVHDEEIEYCKRLGPNCAPLPFNAASWVNKEFYNNYNGYRDIDCLMVANFARFKRHWILFKALSRLPKEVRAVCVGVPLGSRDASSIRSEAELFGVSDRVEVVENPTQEKLREYFQRAKVFCALSFREGSFIAVAEAIVSGTPVVMFENARIGTKRLIMRGNGTLVKNIKQLESTIQNYVLRSSTDSEWCTSSANVDSIESCKALNDILSNKLNQNGQQWSTNIEYFYSMRLAFYYHSEDSMLRTAESYDAMERNGIYFNNVA